MILPLTPFGAPGCYLYTDPLASMVAITNATGAASMPWTVPRRWEIVRRRVR